MSETPFGAKGIHHMTIRVADIDRAAQFYSEVLGFDIEEPPVTDSRRLRFSIGESMIVVRPLLPGAPVDDRFDEHRVGMDHLAVRVNDHENLECLIVSLHNNAVVTQGIQEHPWLPAEFVCFRDPDNIQWEFYRDLPQQDSANREG